MKLLLSIVLLLSVNPGQPLSYPIYGTKRYHRTSSPSLMPSNQPYSYQLNSYYDNQPILSSSSSSLLGSSTGANQLSSYGALPYSITNYPTTKDGYISDAGSNYFYYPNHDYHLYGLPTYHGEYKPKPYYYAPGPKYSYFDDREITPNPLDDLHEEILHEDERIQQRQILQDQPSYFGKESWYQTGPTRQDELTNNFLRNLIAYNRQLEQQERERQLTEQSVNDDYMQRDQYAVYNNEPESEYDEYSDINDYEYESKLPIEPTNVLERKKFEKIKENQQQQILKEQKQREQYQNKFNDIDDEEVKQLKNLAKYSNSKAHNKSPTTFREDEKQKFNKPQTVFTYDKDVISSQKDQKLLKTENSINSILKAKSSPNLNSQSIFIEPVEPETIDESDEWYTPQQSNSNSEKTSYSSAPQYGEPDEYYEDDGTWISWDRKRSNDLTKPNFNKNLSPKTADLIKAFNNRKPQNIKIINSNLPIKVTTQSFLDSKIATTSQPLSVKKFSPVSTKTVKTTTSTTPTTDKNVFGQKEVVLPRPASISQHIFTEPILNMMKSEAKLLFKQKISPLEENSINLQSNNKILIRNSDAVYKTIKQLISMENHLDKESKIQKRYVPNDESLVYELSKLKRNQNITTS